jgi:hypothetical protein
MGIKGHNVSMFSVGIFTGAIFFPALPDSPRGITHGHPDFFIHSGAPSGLNVVNRLIPETAATQ